MELRGGNHPIEIILRAHDVLKGQEQQGLEEFSKIVDRLSEGLDLRELDAIVVPEDFGTEIADFQREHCLRDLGFTNDPLGYAVAKVMKYSDAQRVHRVIVFDKNFFAGVFTREYSLLSQHYIHHELCHVHDEHCKSMLFTEESRSGSGTDLTHLLRILADEMWSEYIACRLSARTLPPFHDYDLPSLYHMVVEIKNRIDGAVNQWHKEDNTDLLWDKVRKDSSFLLRVAAGAIGDIHGLNDSNVASAAVKLVEGTFFEKTWQDLNPSLKELFASYPKWTGIEVYDPLGQVVASCWHSLGIRPSQLPGAIWV
jgi:hypothetical protein